MQRVGQFCLVIGSVCMGKCDISSLFMFMFDYGQGTSSLGYV